MTTRLQRYIMSPNGQKEMLEEPIQDESKFSNEGTNTKIVKKTKEQNIKDYKSETLLGSVKGKVFRQTERALITIRRTIQNKYLDDGFK